MHTYRVACSMCVVCRATRQRAAAGTCARAGELSRYALVQGNWAVVLKRVLSHTVD